MAKALRDEGTEISQLLRSAIRDAYARLKKRPSTPKAIRAYFENLYLEFPAPAEMPPHHGVDTTDRKAVAKYIRDQLARKRPA